MAAAMRLALHDEPQYLGVFYRQDEATSFGERVRSHITGDAGETQHLVDKLIARYS
jgi:hypothetical protein